MLPPPWGKGGGMLADLSPPSGGAKPPAPSIRTWLLLGLSAFPLSGWGLIRRDAEDEDEGDDAEVGEGSRDVSDCGEGRSPAPHPRPPPPPAPVPPGGCRPPPRGSTATVEVMYCLGPEVERWRPLSPPLPPPGPPEPPKPKYAPPVGEDGEAAAALPPEADGPREGGRSIGSDPEKPPTDAEGCMEDCCCCCCCCSLRGARSSIDRRTGEARPPLPPLGRLPSE